MYMYVYMYIIHTHVRVNVKKAAKYKFSRTVFALRGKLPQLVNYKDSTVYFFPGQFCAFFNAFPSDAVLACCLHIH